MSHMIAAVSTGTQISAIGILRMSGDNCISAADTVFRGDRMSLSQAPSRKMILGALTDADGRVIDHIAAFCSRAPHSYTGEDTVEFHCHGSPAVLSAGLNALYHAGFRPAARGEFTKRAFLNGKMDLTQAEAVIDIIEADSADAAANAAGQLSGKLSRQLSPVYSQLTDLCSHFHAVLDYPDEDIEDFGLEKYHTTMRTCAKELYSILQTYGQGHILRQGIAAAIVGKPNTGKSSLLNYLVGYDRAIVTDIPGTTRDTIEETVRLGRCKLRLIDTAGIRHTSDVVEAIGVDRSMAALADAELAIYVCDGSLPLDADDQRIIDLCSDMPCIALINKIDKGSQVVPADLPFTHVLQVSLQNKTGMEMFADCIDELFGDQPDYDGSVLTNARQYDACRRAYEALLKALQGLKMQFTPDAVLLDVEEAMSAMGEVTGASVREDITSRIFERFCVGK